MTLADVLNIIIILAATYSFLGKVFYAAEPGDANLENLVVNEDDMLRRKFQHPRIKKELKFIVKFMDGKGAFDVRE